jgi:hypothetical protein
MESFWVLQKPDKISQPPGATTRHKILYALTCKVGTKLANTRQKGPRAHERSPRAKDTLDLRPGLSLRLPRVAPMARGSRSKARTLKSPRAAAAKASTPVPQPASSTHPSAPGVRPYDSARSSSTSCNARRVLGWFPSPKASCGSTRSIFLP